MPRVRVPRGQVFVLGVEIPRTSRTADFTPLTQLQHGVPHPKAQRAAASFRVGSHNFDRSS